MRRIPRLFQSPGKKLVPFITAGFPDLESTVPLVLAAECAGAHMIELGIPFSDPLADGLVIQRTSQIALSNGVTLDWILETSMAIRSQTQIPIILMGYINPILKMGVAEFLYRASESGVDGLIIPDLPPEEGIQLFASARSQGISTIYLVAPNTPTARIRQLAIEAEDLLYAVSILGVTGSTLDARENLSHYIERVQTASAVPFVVGFGISTPADVVRVADKADGIVVGSALLARLEKSADPVQEATQFLSELTTALLDAGSISSTGEPE
ncbi:MAG: tryptophan synthase subunit alpha [Fidelibacterota bacterium]|nr:MAG: tryptophan synthase subunit alpha [Candidatus Neomarinimicrobiota bacterium]